MRNHHFNNADPGGLCNDVYDQVTCGRPAGASVHQFITGDFDHAEISIEVFVNRDTAAGRSGQHYATVAWQREKSGTWYSAWFTPDRGQGVYHRVEKLDTLTVNMISLHITSLMMGPVSEDELIEMGITNKAVMS